MDTVNGFYPVQKLNLTLTLPFVYTLNSVHTKLSVYNLNQVHTFKIHLKMIKSSSNNLNTIPVKFCLYTFTPEIMFPY